MKGTFVAVDIETTGFDPEKDQMIEIAALRFDEGKIYDSFQTLINPETEIPEVVTHITGIRQSDVIDAPHLSEVQKEFEEFIGDLPIVGHNIDFDVSFLKKKGVSVENELYDTLILGAILLPKFPSYSLETIASHFGVTKKQTHRALDDTTINAKIFQILLRKINQIPESHQEKIEKILEGVSWPMKNFFLNRKFEKGGEGSGSASPERPSLVKKETPLSKKIREALEKNASLLLEAGVGSGKYDALAKAINDHLAEKKETMFIAACSKEIEEYMEKLLPQATILKSSERYVSPKRFWELAENPKKTPREAAFLIKILIWLETTKTGLVDEITLQGEEYNLWEKINHNEWLCEDENAFAKQAEAAKSETPITILHHRRLAEMLFDEEKQEFLKTKDHVIILETEKLEEEMEEALTNRYTLRSIEKKMPDDGKTLFTIFFGLLGIFYEKYLQENETSGAGSGIVEKELKSTPEWKRLKESFRNIWDTITTNGGKRFKKAEKYLHPISKLFLEEDEDSYVILKQNPDADIVLEYMPFEQMKNIWQHPIFTSEKSLILISEAVRVEKSFAYIRGRLQLNREIEEIYIPPAKSLLKKLKIITAQKMADMSGEENFIQTVKLAKKIAVETPGKTIILMPGKKTVHALYYELNTELKEEGIALICQDYSGGKGKMLDRFKKNPETSILCAGFHFLEKAGISALPCENLIVAKLPFDVPNDPRMILQSTKNIDAFAEYSVPKTILRFLGMMNAFLKSPGENKNLYFLDSRIFKKNYGKKFFNSLPEDITIENI